MTSMTELIETICQVVPTLVEDEQWVRTQFAAVRKAVHPEHGMPDRGELSQARQLLLATAVGAPEAARAAARIGARRQGTAGAVGRQHGPPCRPWPGLRHGAGQLREAHRDRRQPRRTGVDAGLDHRGDPCAECASRHGPRRARSILQPGAGARAEGEQPVGAAERDQRPADDRSPDGAAEPPRPGGVVPADVAGVPGAGQAARAGAAGHRRLQEGQRQPRPPGRRRGPAAVCRACSGAACGPTTSPRASAARSSCCCCPARRSKAGRDGAPAAAQGGRAGAAWAGPTACS